MSRFFTVALVVLVMQSATPADQVDPTPETMLQDAASTYQSALETSDRNLRVQKFRTAELLFARLIDRHASPDAGAVYPELYVNLGNAALGAEHVGPAILAYHRALAAAPNHARARQNLDHARTLVADWVPKPEDTITLGSFFDWAKFLSPSQWRGLAAIAFLLAAICFALYFRSEYRLPRNAGFVLAILWIGFVIGSIYQPQDAAAVAVVVAQETTARSADSINSPVRLREPLPGGTEVRIVEDRGQWLRVQLFDGQEVWLAASAVQSV